MEQQQYSPAGFSFLPPVVKNLLIINGLLYLATISMGTAFNVNLTEVLGLHYFKSVEFRPYQIITYMFVHANFGHVFFNMLALWMFGYLVENIWGSKRFLTYYMVTGIGAAAVQMIVQYIHFMPLESALALYNANPGIENFVAFGQKYSPHSRELTETLNKFIRDWSFNPASAENLEMSQTYIRSLYQEQISISTVGASGAVYGILLAFGMLFPNMLVYIYFLFPIKAKWLVIFYGAIELFSGIKANPDDNVAHFAHLGGMIFGLFLILYWRRKIHHH